MPATTFLVRSLSFGCSLLVLFCTTIFGCTVEEGPEARYSASYFAVRGIPFASDSDGRLFLIDTGTPRTMITPGVVGESSRYFGEQAVPLEAWRDSPGFNLGFDELIISDRVHDFSDDWSGIIGVDLMVNRTFTFDPRGKRIHFGEPRDAISDLGSLASHDIDPTGAGRTCIGANCFDYGPNRILIEAQVEGEPARLMVDTGVTDLRITAAFFERLPVEPDRPSYTLSGQNREVSLVRLRSLDIGPQITSVGAVIYDSDARLARLQIETGGRIDGFIGFNILERFATTFDLPHDRILIHELPNLEHFRENFSGVGFTVQDTGSCFEVVTLVESAHVGRLSLGDCIVDLEGRLPGQVDAVADFYTWTRGLPVGAKVTVAVEREGERVVLSDLQKMDFLPQWGEAATTFPSAPGGAP